MMKPGQFLSIASAVLILCLGAIQANGPVEQNSRTISPYIPANIQQFIDQDLCLACLGTVQANGPIEQTFRITFPYIPANIQQSVGTSQLPPIIGRNCGTVSPLLISGVKGGNFTAEMCFWLAYQHCQAATLGYSLIFIDSGTVHQITVQPSQNTDVLTDSEQQFTCALSDASQSVVVINVDPGPVKTYACKGLRPKGDGLFVFGCGEEGDFFIEPA